MAIKDLLVGYNASGSADVALDLAVQMSVRHGATLTGLFVNTPLRLEGRVQRWMSEETLETLRRTEREAGEEVERGFRERLAQQGFDGAVEWIMEQGQPNPALARIARYYDLLLIGQPTEPGDPSRPLRAEDLILMCGAPVLIVPDGFQVRPFNEHAVVAWDGSRSAARAMADAMHILETKKRLDVVTVGASSDGGGGESATTPDVITHLRRHGIDARRVALSASREGIGQTILDYCAEQGPDILVMGAYSRTRLREQLFGGVTRDILRSMTLPVLMAH